MRKAVRGLFLELKRRNVLRAGAFYAAGAWLLVQVATQVFPFFEISNAVVRWIVLAAAIGFPLWLLFAWFYEWTPQGLQRESETAVEPLSNEARASRRTVDRWIIAMLASAVVLLLADKFVLRDRRQTSGGAAEKGIAVLPFANLSRDPENEYFADGIQEEITTRLTQVPRLRVISGTSARRYKDRTQPLAQIASELGVEHILEGSVQKSGDAVRVNVQLINTATDAHLWADIYDRKLTDIFAVESDIAKSVTDALRVRLTGAQERAIAARPTENHVAHELYLKGRYFWFKRTAADLKKAAEFFEQAIAMDPNYAYAYVGFADAMVITPAYGGGTPQECYPKAKAAARRAIEIAPELAEAHASYGKVLWNQDFDFRQSLAELERAIQLNPNYATAHHWYGNSPLASVGRMDEAVEEVKRAVVLDPLSLIFNTDLGVTLVLARRYDEAIETFRRVLELDPNFYYAHYNLGLGLELKGDLPAAIAEYEKARALNDDPVPAGYLGHAYAVAGRGEEASQILHELEVKAKQRYVPNPVFALIELGLGRKDKALDWLEKAYEDREARFIAYIDVDPFLDPLRDEPRFKALAEKVLAKK